MRLLLHFRISDLRHHAGVRQPQRSSVGEVMLISLIIASNLIMYGGVSSDNWTYGRCNHEEGIQPSGSPLVERWLEGFAVC